jgi:hypothetical protein
MITFKEGNVMLLIIGAVILTLCIVLCGLHTRIIDFIYDRFNILSGSLVNAKVVAKQDRDTGWHGTNVVLHRGYFPNIYRITFEFENLKSVQLEVSRKIYNSLSIGSRGILAYNVNEFKKFHVGKTLEMENIAHKSEV